jgi:hypothetical protein
MCIAFPVDESIAVEWDKPVRFRAEGEFVQAHVPVLVSELVGLPTDTIEEMASAMPVENLPVLLSYVQPDALGRQVHAFVHYRDKGVGYAISEKSVALLTERELRERVYHAIAPDLARHLSATLKGKKP